MTMRIVTDMNDWVWSRFREDLKDLSPEEVNWRPLPQANNINLIVRHLRIEAQWQLASLEHGEPMPTETTEQVQSFVDSIGFDFERNLKELDELCTGFITVLRSLNESDIEKRNQLVYAEAMRLTRSVLPPHFLSAHHAMHLCQHWGQIRTIRTLYRKTKGEPIPASFYPDNPSFPHSS